MRSSIPAVVSDKFNEDVAGLFVVCCRSSQWPLCYMNGSFNFVICDKRLVIRVLFLVFGTAPEWRNVKQTYLIQAELTNFQKINK